MTLHSVNARRIIGIDPGKTTGLAVLMASDFQGFTLSDPVAWFDELPEANNVLGHIRSIARPGDLIAVERFVVSSRAGRSASAKAGEQARDIIGAIRDFCSNEHVSLVTYPAVAVKGWATDKRLKAAGLLVSTKGQGHARDAARHALHAARWHGGLPDPLSSAWRERYRFDQGVST